jgi:hypothetical protein
LTKPIFLKKPTNREKCCPTFLKILQYLRNVEKKVDETIISEKCWKKTPEKC